MFSYSIRFFKILTGNWPLLVLMNAPVGLLFGTQAPFYSYSGDALENGSELFLKYLPMISGIFFWAFFLLLMDRLFLYKKYNQFSALLQTAALVRILIMFTLVPDVLTGLLAIDLTKKIFTLPQVLELASATGAGLEFLQIFSTTILMGFFLLLEILVISIPLYGVIRMANGANCERESCGTPILRARIFIVVTIVFAGFLFLLFRA